MKNEERGYELTVLFPLQLKEKDKTQEALKKEIEKAGIIEKEEDWGEKKLAYPIKKNERGHFYFHFYLWTFAVFSGGCIFWFFEPA